jgi:fused signal recognition particle receptor
MGLFDRLKTRLFRTREVLSDGITGLFRGGRAIDDQLLEELEELLFAADLGPIATEIVREIDRLHQRGQIAGEDEVRAVLRELLTGFLEAPDGESGELTPTAEPTVILIVGVNGSGKTTSIAKLAHRFAGQGKSVLLAACDTYRAAAAEQLAEWAERAGAELVRSEPGGDPGAVAFDAIDAARARGADVVIVDTAGRLHTEGNLMDELAKVGRVIAKQIPEAPHETLISIDATTGQNGLRQAQVFSEAVEIDGVVLTKLDGTAKGGIALAIASELELPVKLIGTGEALEDLRPFDPSDFARALLAE